MGIFAPYVVTTADDQEGLLSDLLGQQNRSKLRARLATRQLSKLVVMGVVSSWALLAGSGCAASGGQLSLPAEAATSTRIAGVTGIVSVAERPTAVRASEARLVTIDTGSAAAWRSPRAEQTDDILATTARCPAEMSLVDGRVCVDRWEASLVVRLASGAEQDWSPFQPVDGHEANVRAVSRPGVIPQGYISGEQGARACHASGKRLCGANEWESACRGSQKRRFPYGDERKARACNDDIRSAHPVIEVATLLGIPEERRWFDGMNQPLINQLPDSLLATGARAECTNDYGVFDMVGNLHEWIDDRDGTFRGGYYMDTSLNGEGCSYATTAHDFRYHDYSTGFRCCVDPDGVE